MKKAEIIKFVNLVKDFLVSKEAKIETFLLRVHPKKLGKSYQIQSYILNLNTRAGNLQITIFEDWIACRFENVKEAEVLPISNFNRYSGKWNHHYFECWTPQEAFRNFQREIEKILP